jgi:hypothetical protein
MRPPVRVAFRAFQGVEAMTPPLLIAVFQAVDDSSGTLTMPDDRPEVLSKGNLNDPYRKRNDVAAGADENPTILIENQRSLWFHGFLGEIRVIISDSQMGN